MIKALVSKHKGLSSFGIFLKGATLAPNLRLYYGILTRFRQYKICKMLINTVFCNATVNRPICFNPKQDRQGTLAKDYHSKQSLLRYSHFHRYLFYMVLLCQISQGQAHSIYHMKTPYLQDCMYICDIVGLDNKLQDTLFRTQIDYLHKRCVTRTSF